MHKPCLVSRHIVPLLPDLSLPNSPASGVAKSAWRPVANVVPNARPVLDVPLAASRGVASGTAPARCQSKVVSKHRYQAAPAQKSPSLSEKIFTFAVFVLLALAVVLLLESKPEVGLYRVASVVAEKKPIRRP